MIRVGIIGAGFMGRNHFNQYEKMPERCRVVALCDKEADRRAGDWSKVGGNVADKVGTKRDLTGIRPYTEWRELVACEDIDAIDICAPTFVHREIVAAALAAGKHVLCEKPMALTIEDCDGMLAAAARSKTRFMIAQVIRFWPEYIYLKQAVTDGRYGRLQALHLRRQAERPSYTLGNWILDPDLSGGGILDLHVHDVDFAIHLFGKPDSIYAQGTVTQYGVDRVHASWNYGDGRVVQIEGFWDMPTDFGFNMGYTAVFEKAALVWDMNTGKPLTLLKPQQKAETPQLPNEDGYHAEIRYFLECIEQQRDPQITTPAQSRDAVAMALLEKESVVTGKPVRV